MVKLRKFAGEYVRLLPAAFLLSFWGMAAYEMFLRCRAAYALTVPAGSVDPTASITNLGAKGMLLGGGTLCLISIYQGLQVAGGHGSHTMGSVIGRFIAGAGLTLGGGYLLLDMGAQ